MAQQVQGILVLSESQPSNGLRDLDTDKIMQSAQIFHRKISTALARRRSAASSEELIRIISYTIRYIVTSGR
jgi:hypothetical protein